MIQPPLTIGDALALQAEAEHQAEQWRGLIAISERDIAEARAASDPAEIRSHEASLKVRRDGLQRAMAIIGVATASLDLLRSTMDDQLGPEEGGLH